MRTISIRTAVKAASVITKQTLGRFLLRSLIIIIIITSMIFMVLSSWEAIVKVHPVNLMNADITTG